jgi:hypothetical protein
MPRRNQRERRRRRATKPANQARTTSDTDYRRMARDLVRRGLADPVILGSPDQGRYASDS